MKQKITTLCSIFTFILLIGAFGSQLFAQTVNVKMRINTSTCLDTLNANHIVQVSGESKMGTDPVITWDNSTGIVASNVGGDYWEADFQAQPGDTILYKFVTFFDLDNPTFHWGGWEGPIDAGMPSGDNRALIVGNNDTTLSLQYYNGWEDKVAQYWRPFEEKGDSVAVYFRVNMGGADFDPASQLVDVRGGLPLGGETDWITIVTLGQEVNSVNAGSFWSGVAYVAKADVTVDTEQQFKFVIQPNTWESSANRGFVFSQDIIDEGAFTVHWYYFNDRPPSGPKVTANLLWRLKLDALELAGMFNRALGDAVAVTGAKGWPPSEWDFATEPTMLKMTYNSDLEEWNLLETFEKFPNEIIPYKYYISWDTSRVDTTSPNYIPGLDLTNGWEEPGATGGADRSYTYTAESEQLISGDFGQPQQFFNSLDPRGVIQTPINVQFAIDMTPATNETDNPTNPLFRPGVDTVWVQFDGSFVPITQGLTMYGEDNRIELTDADGDLVYKGSMDLVPPTFNQMCYRIVYTSASGDIMNGGGVLRGRRYYQYVHPVSVSEEGVSSWPSSFELPTLDWMNDSLTVEDPPDFVTDIEESGIVPGEYSISQNYPNPFNPSTKIRYSIPVRSKVTIDVFDITGRKIKNLVNNEKGAGTHIVSWNGRNEAGLGVSTGIYFLKINAGFYTNTIKMMMLK